MIIDNNILFFMIVPSVYCWEQWPFVFYILSAIRNLKKQMDAGEMASQQSFAMPAWGLEARSPVPIWMPDRHSGMWDYLYWWARGSSEKPCLTICGGEWLKETVCQLPASTSHAYTCIETSPHISTYVQICTYSIHKWQKWNWTVTLSFSKFNTLIPIYT